MRMSLQEEGVGMAERLHHFLVFGDVAFSGDWANITQNEPICPGNEPGDIQTSAVVSLQSLGRQSMMFQVRPIALKCVRQQNLSARVRVCLMNRLHFVRMSLVP